MSSAPVAEIHERLARARRIIIFGHVGPDGDAIGSALGLMWLLQAQGTSVTVSFEDPVDELLHFLPGVEWIDNHPVDGHDLIVALDGSDADRYGAHFAAALADPARPPLLCIDHHKTNTRFADLEWVDSEYAATAQMLYHLAREAGWPLSAEAATCLATGCVTDTNAFSTDHTTPELLEAVAALMREGAPLALIIRQTMNLRTRSDALLWGRILSTARVESGVAWAISTHDAREAIGAGPGDGSGISTFLRNIVGVHVGILFVEAADGVRISMRSEPGYDVGSLAFALGGGGHTQAAGVTLDGELDEVVARVVARASVLVAEQA